jgi:hypothetical protein
MNYRSQFANDLAFGLCGWLQLQAAQKLGDLSGEDSARLIAAQIVNAQGQFRPEISQAPANWGSDSKKRVDIALKAKSKNSSTWYGAIEIKWPGRAFDVAQTRTQIVQDAMRVALVPTNGTNAHFLVLGGSSESLYRLFDKQHKKAELEAGRSEFSNLLVRNKIDETGEMPYKIWSSTTWCAADRVPDARKSNFNGKLTATLLAAAQASIGSKVEGQVFVWQCNRTRGSKAS